MPVKVQGHVYIFTLLYLLVKPIKISRKLNAYYSQCDIWTFLCYRELCGTKNNVINNAT